MPAENKELLVLVTESASEKADQELFKQLQNLETLQCLTLVAGTSEGDLMEIQPASKEAV